MAKGTEELFNGFGKSWDNERYGIALEALASKRPPWVVTNPYIIALLKSQERYKNKDLDPDVIFERTGINTRRWLARGGPEGPKETSMIPYIQWVGAMAMAEARVYPEQLSFYENCSSTPDYLSPGNASIAAEAWDGFRALSTDRIGACASAGVSIRAAIEHIIATMDSEQYNNEEVVAMITADEKLSQYLGIDEQEMATQTLSIFGDGTAGAIFRGGVDNPGKASYYAFHDRRGSRAIVLKPGGIISMPDGAQVKREAIQDMTFAARQALRLSGLSADEVVVAAHQANYHIVMAIAEKLGLDESQVILHIDETANTSAVSVLLAMDIESRLPNNKLMGAKNVLLLFLGAGWNCLAVCLPWKDLNRKPVDQSKLWLPDSAHNT